MITNKFTRKELKKKSLSTLYRMRKAVKDSEGTFIWYLWPCNIEKILNKLIKEKNNEKMEYIKKRNTKTC